MGIPYDSDQGRAWAGALTAIMCGQAYLTSARLAEAVGPVRRLSGERAAISRSDRHASRFGGRINKNLIPTALYDGAWACWNGAYQAGTVHGYRNAQVTVIAPTGTIGFMMDCDTTGIEPDLALVKYKKLVGGGVIKIVNNTVPQALIKLGYSPETADQIVEPHRPDRNDRRHAAAEARASAGVRLQLPPAEWHAVDPLHRPPEDDGGGAAVRLRRDFEDHQHAGRVHGGRRDGGLHRELAAGPQGGRDLPRQLQARAAAELRDVEGRQGGERRAAARQTVEKIVYRPIRRKLPDERRSITHKFSIGGHEGYITAGMYEDGTPGRDLHRDGEGGLDHLRPDGQLRHGDQLQSAVRRAAEVPGGQVQPCPFRAERVYGQSARFRTPSPSWITSSAGLARSSWDRSMRWARWARR